LSGAAGEAEYLAKLPAVLAAETVVSEQGVANIDLLRIDLGVGSVREKGRDGEGSLGVLEFTVQERPERLAAMPRGEGQIEVVIERTSVAFGGKSWGGE